MQHLNLRAFRVFSRLFPDMAEVMNKDILYLLVVIECLFVMTHLLVMPVLLCVPVDPSPVVRTDQEVDLGQLLAFLEAVFSVLKVIILL